MQPPQDISVNLHEEVVGDTISQGIIIDLKDPVLQNGVLKTTKGGVITADNIRIQARTITYTRKVIDGKSVFKIEADGDLMIDYGDRVFVGTHLVYDFNTQRGLIDEATTAVEPWYIGGKVIRLLPDGKYTMEEGYITTCPSAASEWQIHADNVSVPKDNQLAASNIQMRFLKIPLFWVPTFTGNVRKILRAPIKWKFHFGGARGSRLTMRYRFMSREQFNAFLRLDLRRRGLGGGIETEYFSKDKQEKFLTRNYVANDFSVADPSKSQRFRFAGEYSNRVYNDKVSIDAHYDRLSDADMPSDFNLTDFSIITAQRTQVLIQRFHPASVQSIIARIRINPFQTLNQELPTFDWRFRPFVLGDSGIISDNDFEACYLNFVYAKGSSTTDYNSPRYHTENFLYRPFPFSFATFTPQAGFVGNFYGNSPGGDNKWKGIGVFGAEIHSTVYRHFGESKHTVTPYVNYKYYTTPTTSPDLHFIFDANDAWSSLNLMRVGMRHNIYSKSEGKIFSDFSGDIYANAFFDTNTLSKKVPKIYGDFKFTRLRNLLVGLNTAWDFRNDQIDHYNILTKWTRNEDFAISAEYRHRKAFDWRKADRTRFLLESFRTETALQNSSLSDERSTVLANCFYRFAPKWTLHVQSRYGRRKNSPRYLEYQADVITTIRCNWQIKFSYQKQESDDRFSFHFKLVETTPEDLSVNPLLWP